MAESASGEQASADEIEVTQEMEEAGFAVLCASGIADEYLEADKGLVAEIYRAMARRSARTAAVNMGQTPKPGMPRLSISAWDR